MQYNTAKNRIRNAEYGRGVQSLIEHAKTIEDKDERQACVEEIIELMQIVSQTSKKSEDYHIKLWSHLMQIANYELDVKTPDDWTSPQHRPVPDKHMPYPAKKEFKHRYYGRYTHELIERCTTIEEPERRHELLETTAAYMKHCYITWNKDSGNDEDVRKDLRIITKGALDLDESTNMDWILNSDKKSKQSYIIEAQAKAAAEKKKKKKKRSR